MFPRMFPRIKYTAGVRKIKGTAGVYTREEGV
jgi:hypothetical protein